MKLIVILLESSRGINVTIAVISWQNNGGKIGNLKTEGNFLLKENVLWVHHRCWDKAGLAVITLDILSADSGADTVNFW